MGTSIPKFAAKDDVVEICAALDEAGCVVIEDMIDPASLAAIRSDLAANIEGAYYSDNDKPEDFYPAKTQRLIGIMKKLPSIREQIIHPVTTALCQHHLGENCERFQLHASSALVVGPGARDQILHREEDPFDYFDVPRPNLVIASMAAISDFTADNGGTLLVPGSHKWEAGREAKPEEVVAAEMKAGSMLFWLGGTLHGAGSNITDGWRQGIILSYSLAWLRQEENVYMNLDSDTIKELSPEIQDRLGFTMHDESLGFFDPGIRLS